MIIWLIKLKINLVNMKDLGMLEKCTNRISENTKNVNFFLQNLDVNVYVDKDKNSSTFKNYERKWMLRSSKLYSDDIKVKRTTSEPFLKIK
jgi:hypothetical protein